MKQGEKTYPAPKRVLTTINFQNRATYFKKHYQEFTLNVLGTIDSLGSLMSTFVMDEGETHYGIPIGNL